MTRLMLNLLRKHFITGMVVLLPLGVTIWIVLFLVNQVGRPASRIFFRSLQVPMQFEFVLNLLGTLLVFVLITFLGYFSNLLLGRLFIRGGEMFVEKLPVVSKIYGTVKQIVTTFSEQQKSVFQNVVLVQFPRSGSYAIGFLTGEAKGEIQDRTGKTLINIFIPTTPNPTNGFLVFIPRDEVIFMDMPVVEGMKVVISGGAVVPPYRPGEPAPDPVRIQNPAALSTSDSPPASDAKSD